MHFDLNVGITEQGGVRREPDGGLEGTLLARGAITGPTHSGYCFLAFLDMSRTDERRRSSAGDIPNHPPEAIYRLASHPAVSFTDGI